MLQWIKERFDRIPLRVQYKRQLRVYQYGISITGLMTALCLYFDAPAINAIPWAVMFGLCIKGLITMPLLIETQGQIEDAMEMLRDQ